MNGQLVFPGQTENGAARDAVQNFAAAKVRDKLAAPTQVIKEYEHKGHRFVELDVIVTANDSAVITRVHHTAIYRPRQVTRE